jgi:putative ABC transport system ATP-binding protein
VTIEINDVTKDYPLGTTVVHALKGITLSIKAQEFTTLSGPSGCGKTTLLNLIGGMDVPTSGELSIDNQPISKLNDRQLTQLRLDKIGFIFQSFNLIPVLDVYQNIEFPLLISGKSSKSERALRVNELIDRVGLAAQRHQRPSELSGGQRQRVAVARALVTRPAFVLADEPTANLDSETGRSIIELMKEMNRTLNTTFVFSTHDPSIMAHASRIIHLKDGMVVS